MLGLLANIVGGLTGSNDAPCGMSFHASIKNDDHCQVKLRLMSFEGFTAKRTRAIALGSSRSAFIRPAIFCAVAPNPLAMAEHVAMHPGSALMAVCP